MKSCPDIIVASVANPPEGVAPWWGRYRDANGYQWLLFEAPDREQLEQRMRVFWDEEQERLDKIRQRREKIIAATKARREGSDVP